METLLNKICVPLALSFIINFLIILLRIMQDSIDKEEKDKEVKHQE